MGVMNRFMSFFGLQDEVEEIIDQTTSHRDRIPKKLKPLPLNHVRIIREQIMWSAFTARKMYVLC